MGRATSPVIGLLLMSVTAAMDHLPLCGDKPLRALSLTLVQMMLMLGPMASETTAALADDGCPSRGRLCLDRGDRTPNAAGGTEGAIR